MSKADTADTAPVQGIPDEVRKLVERAASLAVQVKLHNQVGLVEISTRGKFDIGTHTTFLTYDTFEAVYAGILQLRHAKHMSLVKQEDVH